MKNFMFFYLMIVFSVNIHSQINIEIGKDAYYIKRLVEFAVKQNHSYDSFGNKGRSNVNYDVHYWDGKISEVILCYDDAFIEMFQTASSYCQYFIMEDEKLSYVVNQFENISLEKLISIFDKMHHNKYNNYYFSDDFTYCSELFLAENGQATEKWMITDLSKFPKNLRKLISEKLKDHKR